MDSRYSARASPQLAASISVQQNGRERGRGCRFRPAGRRWRLERGEARRRSTHNGVSEVPGADDVVRGDVVSGLVDEATSW